jgi:hypothetical protein
MLLRTNSHRSVILQIEGLATSSDDAKLDQLSPEKQHLVLKTHAMAHPGCVFATYFGAM